MNDVNNLLEDIITNISVICGYSSDVIKKNIFYNKGDLIKICVDINYVNYTKLKTKLIDYCNEKYLVNANETIYYFQFPIKNKTIQIEFHLTQNRKWFLYFNLSKNISSNYSLMDRNRLFQEITKSIGYENGEHRANYTLDIDSGLYWEKRYVSNGKIFERTLITQDPSEMCSKIFGCECSRLLSTVEEILAVISNPSFFDMEKIVKNYNKRKDIECKI